MSLGRAKSELAVLPELGVLGFTSFCEIIESLGTSVSDLRNHGLC